MPKVYLYELNEYILGINPKRLILNNFLHRLDRFYYKFIPRLATRRSEILLSIWMRRGLLLLLLLLFHQKTVYFQNKETVRILCTNKC